MATITQVKLTLQKSHNPSPSSSRNVTVKFTTRFTAAEVQGRSLFNAEVKLQQMEENSLEGEPSINLGIETVRATASVVETTIVRTFTRRTLDEDSDSVIIIDPGSGEDHVGQIEMKDQWRARVVLTPVIQTVSRNSAVVTGSWGVEGGD